MKFNYKKVATVLGSALMLGSTFALAAAASYPAPFVQNGAANIAIVVGSKADTSDWVAAANINGDLASELAAQTATGGTTDTDTIVGDAVSLDSGSTRIWLNTSLNVAKSTLTKTDLPVVLGESTFSGDVDAKLTSTIKVGSGVAAGGDNSGKIIFSKQPKSSDDPSIVLSMGDSTAPLYNASVTMKAVNFTDSDSEGENIKLFGKDFVVSTATDATSLVLFSSAKEVSLSAGTADSVTSTEVDVAGSKYTVRLVTGTSTTATIEVNGESKEVNEGSSKKIGGIDVAVKSVTESTALNTVTATLLVGSQKITFTNGATVTMGSDDDPIDGTKAYLVGTPTALTELAVEVYKASSSEDAIVAGTPFVDPVFGSFKVAFEGISSPLDDSARDSIKIQNSGDDTISMTMTDDSGNTKTIEFAHNATSAANLAGNPVKKPANWRLADDSNYSIFVSEGANLTEDDIVVLGNEDYGHMVTVTQIYNDTGTDFTNDKVKVQDKFTDEVYSATFTTEGKGTLNIDGKQYAVSFLGSGDDGYATLKYPTSDASTVNTWVVYPTMKTKAGALVSLYEPLNVSLAAFNGTTGTSALVLNFPDGDGYTPITITYTGLDSYSNFTVSGGGVLAANLSTNYTSFTVGKLTYNITSAGTGTAQNRSMIYLVNPEVGGNIVDPSIILFEGKDDNNAYEAVVITMEGNAASMGSSTNGVGVSDVLFTTAYGHYSATKASDSDVTQDVDWYGTLTTINAGDSDQKTLDISYPSDQVYSKVFLGENSAAITTSVSSGSVKEIGAIIAKDSEASTYADKNLIVIGGSCVNTIAAELLENATCGDSFTAKAGVKAGEALIKSFTRGTKIALLVAGYNGQDTANAAVYLTNKGADTTVGAAMKVTSATEATSITA